jgi:integrase
LRSQPTIYFEKIEIDFHGTNLYYFSIITNISSFFFFIKNCSRANFSRFFELAKIYDAAGDVSKKWFVYFSYRDPRSGQMKRFREFKGIQKQSIIAKRYEAAEKLKNEINDKLRIGWNPFIEQNAIYEDDLTYHFAARVFGKLRAGNKSFNYYSSEFLKSVSGLDHNTVVTYKSKLRIFNQYLTKLGIEANDISSISNEIITGFFHFIINERKLSGNSSGKYKILLNSVFDLAVERKSIASNPVHHVPINTRVNDFTPRPIHEKDISIWREALMKIPQLWLAVQFEYYCYLRPGQEIRLMKIGWIDFGNGQILIPKNFAKTKTDKIITIPVQFLEILEKEFQLHNFPRNYYVFGKNGMPGETHLGKNNLKNRFVNVRKSLNMPDQYKLYSFKHTGNVRARSAGVPITERQAQNGHTSQRTTEIYTKNIAPVQNTFIRNHFPTL